MKQTVNERFIILLVSIACLGLSIESIMIGWEFWVPPLIIIGIICLWFMQISGKPEFGLRKVLYCAFIMLAIFYHGVHSTSFFDVALIAVLSLITFSLFDSVIMMNVILFEYIVLLIIQIFLNSYTKEIVFDELNISRVILHICVVGLVYFDCVKSIHDHSDRKKSEEEKDAKIEAVDADMEDFLSNISHELRTPVNVVNGMSEMLIKKGVGEEIFSIKRAGIRLAYQIEDIQDYTECKRKKVILEEDVYMSTSLINDVVVGFRFLENDKNLELIVDMAPTVPTKMKGDVKKLHKIFRHLLENAMKFTRRGGIYVKLFTENTDYGVNLCIEMTDTGIGMDSKAVALVSEGMYQVNKKRNRSSGGIGLGLYIVYGFAHRMGGFVNIESEKGKGTTVRVTIPQEVVDKHPCLTLSKNFHGDILFHVRSDKYKVPKVRDFYRAMASNLAAGIRVSLYPTQTVQEIEDLKEKLNVSAVFMGQEEYEENPEYFDEMSRGDIIVAVSAYTGFKANPGSRVIVMPKPLYAYPVIKVINEGRNVGDLSKSEHGAKPVFRGVRALVVDDEPMNLVVATGLFKEYEMIIDTAGSGKESIAKFKENDYDVIFMDHMMPEMDGVEAMKLLKKTAEEMGKSVVIIALTANAVSGAREMFIREGFNGFIAKPINIADFERVMLRELPGFATDEGGNAL